MRHIALGLAFACLGACLLGGTALGDDALDKAAAASAAKANPAFKPDPSHIPFTLPANIPWKCNDATGQCQASLFGDPSKPGIYGVLIKWLPGHFSHPHFHSTDRFIYVISGNWWVSSSQTFDMDKTYPIPAGSFVTDIANTVHWDGAKDVPAILELVGTGPVVTTQAEKK